MKAQRARMQVKLSRFSPCKEAPCSQGAGYSRGCAGLALMGSLKTGQGIIAIQIGTIYEEKKEKSAIWKKKENGPIFYIIYVS